jgi:hypothetical protein
VKFLVTAVIVDRSLEGSKPVCIEYPVKDWGAAVNDLVGEYAAQHRGGHMPAESHIELLTMTVINTEPRT